jgi:KaiC/GvpD/RAD55 family RecA-like ATPase
VTLAENIIARFAGRRDLIAVGAGDTFAPEQCAPTAKRIESDHLGGTCCLGFYVLDEQSRCCCTAADFDNKPHAPDPLWREHAEQFYYALLQFGLSPLVEISQSGQAAHVWLFLSEPTDAWIPRAFWRALARRLDAKCPEIYPRQDRHEDKSKAVGNLIRYPLWNRSAFVDVENDWTPIDPVEAIENARLTTGTDLKLIAFQAGLGELSPDPRVELAAIDIGGGAILPIRVARMIADPGTMLGKRWRNDPAGMDDKSRSAVALSLCCELVRAYVPTPEIHSALRAWLDEHDPDRKYDREKWRDDTVLKAYDFVVQRREVRSVAATTFRDAAHAYIDLIESNSRVYVPSGIAELDESIDGIAPGEVCVIAARPGHGKSALAIQWLASAARLGVRCLFISEEMSHVEIGKRRLLSITDVPQEQWVAASAAVLRKDVNAHHENAADVYLVEQAATIDRVDELIDQFCGLYHVGLVAIDYCQLLHDRTKKDRYEVVTEISRRVKQSAGRNHVPILMLSQLNREVEKRDDNEPKLSDLRESGGIEQDADLVLMAQYPCKFDASAPDDLYRIVVPKRRNGPVRKPRIELRFNPHRQIVGMPDLPDELKDL